MSHRPTKHEQTIVAALKEGWYIEEIEELPGLSKVEPLTIHNVAKRHHLKAKHAPKGYMRRKRIAADVRRYGLESTLATSGLQVSTVRRYAKEFNHVPQ
jgi:uncharacterized phage protein gp47/JayE